MIVFDNVVVKGFDQVEYVLNFHVPFNKTTLIILPSSVSKVEIAEYIAGLSKPIRGNIIRELGSRVVKPTIYIPEQLVNELLLVDIVNSLNPNVFREISSLINSIGYRLEFGKLSLEIPEIIKKLFLILYTLYSADYLAILIEPFLEFDNKILSILSSEFKRLNSRDLTIVILTSMHEYLESRVDLYDYAVVIEPGYVIEGERDKFKTTVFPTNIEIYEIWSRESIVNKLLSIDGFSGYLKISSNKYFVFINSKYRSIFLNIVNEMIRNKHIAYFRQIVRETAR